MQNYMNNALLGESRAVNQEICITKQIFGEIKKIIRYTIINYGQKNCGKGTFIFIYEISISEKMKAELEQEKKK